MTKEFIITCPNCDETFAADDAFKNHLKNKEKELEKNLQKQISAKLEKQYELDIQKKDKEAEIANRRQLQRISEMEKQLKQKSMELQGEGQEELIEDYLSRKFPSD